MVRYVQGWHLLLMVAMIIGFVGFWVVVALMVRAVIQGGSRAPAPPPAGPDPLHILDERLARGEIDPAEYAERRRLLENGGTR